MSFSCECCLGDTRRITPRDRWPEHWGCDDCGHVEVVARPDHVIIGHPNTVLCTACGHSYRWNVPVSIPLFVAGNTAFGYDHRKCPERLKEARAALLHVLDERVGQVEAETMARDWDEAKRRGEI